MCVTYVCAIKAGPCATVQPGITPRRGIDTLVHLARRVLCDALPDQSVKSRVTVRVMVRVRVRVRS